jgi:hypothetical protein
MIYPNIVQSLYESPIKWVLLFLHWVMFSFPIIITLLTNDLSVLIMINMLLFMVLTMNIIYQDCPITIIENLYLEDNMINTITSPYTPSYSKLTSSDKTLQCLFVGLMVVTSKILLVLAKHTFIEYIGTTYT